MSLYLALDLLILALPVALSFDRRVRYFRRWGHAGLTAILVAAPFIAWDSVMTASGAWSFSERYSGSIRIFHLPPGELAFFLAVPFSCLFIYETVGAYFPEKTVPGGRLPWLAASAACAAAAILLRGRLYTAAVLAAASTLLLLAVLLLPGLLSSRRFWLTIGLSYLPFLLFNGLLTGLPVVVYGETAITGLRLGPIPAEDFLYSFCLLGLALLAYNLMRSCGVRTRP